MRAAWIRGLLAAALLGPVPAAASEIVVLGDSWGALFGGFDDDGDGLEDRGVLRDKLDAEGFGHLDLSNLSIGGTTSAGWAAGNHGDLGDLLGAHPDARAVHVSLGGNDLLGGLSNPIGTINQTIADSLSVLQQIVAATSAPVVMTGYDYLPGTLPGLDNALINLFLNVYVDNLAIGVAADPTLASQVTILNTHGLMQVHFGVPQNGIDPFDPSLPDDTLPGPSTAFADNIHLTQAGYGVYIDEVWDSFYGPTLVPEPRVALLVGVGVLASLCAGRLRRD